jgi:hypothetical protein
MRRIMGKILKFDLFLFLVVVNLRFREGFRNFRDVIAK